MDLHCCKSPSQILHTFNSFEPKASFNIHHCWRILRIRRGSMELGRLHDLRQSWHLWEQAIYLWAESKGLKGPQTRRCGRAPKHNLAGETNINTEGDSELSSLFPTAKSNLDPSSQLTTSEPNSEMKSCFESPFDESGIDESGIDESGIDESRFDESRFDESGFDESHFEESRFEESNIDPLLLGQQGNHMDNLQYYDPYSTFPSHSSMQDIQSSITRGGDPENNIRYDDPKAAYS